MKVLFLIQDRNLPSSRVRVINLLSELKDHGIEYDLIPYSSRLSQKIEIFKKIRKYDAIFLQKKLISPIESFILRILSPYLIFDFDDAIYLRHDENKNPYSKTRYFKFKFLVKNSDLIIAGNRILKEFAERFNKNVVIIPSAVEIRNIPLKDHNHENERIVIGWVGGGINLIHLNLISDVLKELSRSYDIELRILSNRELKINGVNVKFIPWSLENQEKEISLFDIGVMPLPDTEHARGKCGYKALQYMAQEVPPVVSDVGVMREIVEDGVEGFVVNRIDDFYSSLKRLIENKELRIEMGKNARKKVERFYSIEVVSKMLVDIFKSI